MQRGPLRWQRQRRRRRRVLAASAEAAAAAAAAEALPRRAGAAGVVQPDPSVTRLAAVHFRDPPAQWDFFSTVGWVEIQTSPCRLLASVAAVQSSTAACARRSSIAARQLWQQFPGRQRVMNGWIGKNSASVLRRQRGCIRRALRCGGTLPPLVDLLGKFRCPMLYG